jgi:DNA-directed RNA polymerase specialized sigma subunit
MSNRNRSNHRGSAKPLTDDMRAKIRKLLQTDLTQDEIAVRLGIAQSSVSRVKREAAE